MSKLSEIHIMNPNAPKLGVQPAYVQSYKLVELRDREAAIDIVMYIDNRLITDRLYKSRLGYFIRCIREQLNVYADYSDFGIFELLEHCKKQPIMVDVSYSVEYGVNYNYNLFN